MVLPIAMTKQHENKEVREQLHKVYELMRKIEAVKS